MKKIATAIMICAASLVFCAPAFAGETEAYVSGGEGIMAATLPPPGFYIRDYNVFYSADLLKDDGGNTLPVNFDLSVLADVHRFVWVTKKRVLGADYAFDVIIPVLCTGVKIGAYNIDDHKFGLGDIALEPFVLSWHRSRSDFSTGVAFYLPTGEFNPEKPASPGKDYWTTMFTLGGTVYFDTDKTWSASILNRYEVHSNGIKRDINPGDDFHFEWGIGKKINDLWTVGLAGYCQWQVSDDSGSDVYWDRTVRDRVKAIGPEVDWVVPKWKSLFQVRILREFEAHDRPQGTFVAFVFTKAF